MFLNFLFFFGVVGRGLLMQDFKGSNILILFFSKRRKKNFFLNIDKLRGRRKKNVTRFFSTPLCHKYFFFCV